MCIRDRREIVYPYEKILKVNFDFAREQAFTHVMEILDKDYHYRLYYIGRVSRRTPVSYTHLDVYKRQDINRKRADRNLSARFLFISIS